MTVGKMEPQLSYEWFPTYAAINYYISPLSTQPSLTRGTVVHCNSYSKSKEEKETVSLNLDPDALAAEVTIHRDKFGVPHIVGPTDESVIFGYGYAQAEDYFWQLEDSYILALGRYSEVVGPKGINSRSVESRLRDRPFQPAGLRRTRCAFATVVCGLRREGSTTILPSTPKCSRD